MVITKVVEFAPKFLKSAVALTPKSLTCGVIEHLFGQVFKTNLLAGSFDFLAERWVRIEVTDLGLKFCISVQSSSGRMRFKVKSECDQADVFMRVDWSALLQLSTQQVDPDTLFFRRKLLLTGDTELGLQVKNLLDTIELEQRLSPYLYQQLVKFAAATAHANEKQIAASKSLTEIK
ncbi:ubiquinone anaerobic biosynthesis accessory factor UbiT [Pseudidiomarina sp. E22-M8]|uniref:ubiquinone anaerobic biosynthesis accessory factor UbiT n=1 Tax=Pseudidiomarina sp. E22-M8 TaxID=3424768 RepID=UPI00403D33D0